MGYNSVNDIIGLSSFV